VPAPALFTLGAHRPVAPGADSVGIAQNRIKEKAHFERCGVPVAPYAVIETPEQLAAIIEARRAERRAGRCQPQRERRRG
jgi:5-(carboxyamino)imidazole ribonucleotide synthase